MTCVPLPTVLACAMMPAWCLWVWGGSSSQPRAMFLQNTAVHHDENACSTCFFCGFFVDHLFLHPDCRDFQLDGLVDNLFHELGPPEDVHDIDRMRHIE